MSYQELPVSMHPRYPEFLEFMRDCPYRKTPSEMQTAFWAWLNKSGNQSLIVVEQAKEIKSLKNDLDRLYRERDNFQQQCSAMAEENNMLEQRIKHLESVLDFGSVGERAEACLSIDGGNL
jgi:hypothetical protein